MQSCDVVVVGGGPAGSSCARDLVEGGLSVAVLDRDEFPRLKLCAGWITPEALDDLGLTVDSTAGDFDGSAFDAEESEHVVVVATKR